jgi:aerobic-type carbon monoxide dehydrogenase small subunit (CoxS/CutS family)
MQNIAFRMVGEAEGADGRSPSGAAARLVRVRVNGEAVERAVAARVTLADFLREELDLTGTHVGCGHGVCGACTVLLDGASVRSCLLLAVQADGRAVTTVEGLAGADGSLHPAQRAFAQEHGLQCGFCTPGFLMTTVELLDEGRALSRPEIRERLSGNLCRCTGYQNLVTAVETAFALQRQAETRG